MDQLPDVDARWRDADVFLIIFSIDDLTTWEEAKFIIETVLITPHFSDKIKVLVGNKIDLASERKVTTEEVTKVQSSVSSSFLVRSPSQYGVLFILRKK